VDVLGRLLKKKYELTTMGSEMTRSMFTYADVLRSILAETLKHYDLSDRRLGVRFEHLKPLLETCPLLPSVVFEFLLEQCLVSRHEPLRRDVQKLIVLLFVNRTEDTCTDMIRLN
jgi:hypothetical protein